MSERLFVRLEDDPLYAPETTVPGGTMREFAVPAALRPFVAHAMAYEEHLCPRAKTWSSGCCPTARCA